MDRQLERYLLSAGATAYGEPQVFAEADAVRHERFGEVAVVELLPAKLPPPPTPAAGA